MADPVKPDGRREPGRGTSDQNVTFRRRTDPRMRLDGLRSASGEGLPIDAPTQPSEKPPPPTHISGILPLPGQQLPPELDYDAPTVAVDIDPTVPMPAPPRMSALDPPTSPTMAKPVSTPPMASFDPPVQPASMANLDPPMPPQRTRVPTRPMANLDPAIEPSKPVPRAGNSGSFSRPKPDKISGSFPQPKPDKNSGSFPKPAADKEWEPETSGSRTRPPDVAAKQAKNITSKVLASLAAVACVAVVIVALGDRGAATGAGIDDKRLTDVWLAHGTKRWGGVRPADDPVSIYVAGVGDSVAKVMQTGDRTPRFIVLNDDLTTQAFALPDGSVAVTVALLRRLNNDAQLAGILAHSLAHIVSGDLIAAQAARAELAAAGKEALSTSSADAPAVKAAVELVLAASTTAASPGQEQRADATAVTALEKAGFMPVELKNAVKNLGVTGGTKKAEWLTQHPDDPNRQNKLGEAKAAGRTGDREYSAKILDIVGRYAKPPPPTR